MALEDEIMALVQVLNKLRASIKDMFLAKVWGGAPRRIQTLHRARSAK